MKTNWEHRGFMLDVSRHIMPVEDIKTLIRAAAACGMNRMHWHLVDDQGWRIEIKRYPRLTDLGGYRGSSYFGGVSQREHNDGFYTQAEAAEIVAFAQAHGIEVIPEIEMPGHATAMLAAYPEYGCLEKGAPRRYQVARGGGIFPNLLCAGRDECLRFMEDILDEIMAIFPFPMIHIGGDEALKLRWRRCPDCQIRMRAEGLATEDDLQRWLVLQIGAYLARHARRTIVWNDVLDGGLLPSHFVVQQWRGISEQARAFMAAGGQVIVSDMEDHYFDYPYGAIDVHRIWRHPLIPEYAQGYEDRLLGAECPLWTERVTNIDRAAYLLFPRLAAMGLRWTGEDFPDWDAFCERVREAMKPVEALGLRGAPESDWRMSDEQARADRDAEHARIHAPEALEHLKWERGVVRAERVERLMEQIGMPRRLTLQVGDMLLREAEHPYEEADEPCPGALELGHQLAQAVDNRANGDWRGLPEDVWLATMRAFTRFVREYHASHGRYGFDRGFWTRRQVEAVLLRLGELEYELVEEIDRKHIDLHIPSDAELSPEKLNASVARARAFFGEYLPDWADAPMTCHSWLLSPVLKDLLDANSRILRFQAAFDIETVKPDSDDWIQWVFGVADDQRGDMVPEALPEDTGLQRRAKALLMKRKGIGSATGTLARGFESAGM